MTDGGVSGIVLAGGRSSRFGSDKLAAPFGGVPLLDRAVAAIADPVIGCSEIVVVLAPGDDRELPSAALPVRRALDPAAHGGPLVGLLAGLEAAREPVVLVVGGDMPTLSPDVLAALLRALLAAERSADAAVLIQRGVRRPLPAVFRNGAASPLARRLIGDGERSLMALLRGLATRELAEGEWRGLDPTGATLRDVDLPEDLPEDMPGGPAETRGT
jgi:molybdopterin-guanine dinucleotide biosynthesis protein A